MVWFDAVDERASMGFRNYVGRTLLLLALALAVGLAVAITSGDERARMIRGTSSLLTTGQMV